MTTSLCTSSHTKQSTQATHELALWRSTACLGGSSHWWVPPVNTHSTPLPMNGRLWPAQHQPLAQHKISRAKNSGKHFHICTFLLFDFFIFYFLLFYSFILFNCCLFFGRSFFFEQNYVIFSLFLLFFPLFLHFLFSIFLFFIAPFCHVFFHVLCFTFFFRKTLFHFLYSSLLSTLLYFLLFFTSLLRYFFLYLFFEKHFLLFNVLTFCWCKTRFVATRSISPSTGKSLLGFNSGLDNEWHGESRG